MIIGFSKHGTGGAAKPIRYLTAETFSKKALDYLTGKDRNGMRRDPAPFVVRGDPDRTKALIDSLRFKHKYTSGVLSFAPGETITPEMESSIIDQFELTAFAGLDTDQYDILWVRHRHTASHRHELHFITPRVELSSGRSLNIAPPRKSTRKLFDALRTKINLEFGLADPDDPTRARTQHGRQPDSTRSGRGLQKTEQAATRAFRIRELEEKLQSLTQSRSEYNKNRYATAERKPQQQPSLRPDTPPANPISYDRIGTPPPGLIEAPGIPLRGTRPGIHDEARRFDETSYEWGRAHERLERTAGRFESAAREVTITVEQEPEIAGGWDVVGSILLRFAIPIRHHSDQVCDRDTDHEPEMGMPL